MFGFVQFWIFVFWILRPVDIWTPGIVFPCTVGARVGEYYHLYMHHIYTYTYVHEHAPLAKLGFCSALLRTSIIKTTIVEVLIIELCLVPVLIATMMVKALVPVWIY